MEGKNNGCSLDLDSSPEAVFAGIGLGHESFGSKSFCKSMTTSDKVLSALVLEVQPRAGSGVKPYSFIHSVTVEVHCPVD